MLKLKIFFLLFNKFLKKVPSWIDFFLLNYDILSNAHTIWLSFKLFNKFLFELKKSISLNYSNIHLSSFNSSKFNNILNTSLFQFNSNQNKTTNLKKIKKKELFISIYNRIVIKYAYQVLSHIKIYIILSV